MADIWRSLTAQLGAGAGELVAVLVSVLAIYAWVVLANRLLGLRSFAKLSAFDFAMTVAVGSIIAGVALGNAPVASGLVAVAVLFFSQWAIAKLRQQSRFDRTVDNEPLLLMHEGQVMHEALAAARLTPDDLTAKLRAANVLDPAEVHAVVFETTGDMTVLHGKQPLDPSLLNGVRRASEHPRT
ncbi:DUF421 domain-containing protein [Egicoccus halophilus]|uniref:DUF421 domain-containing protein n=1 Tax=Egicoccus halophilus TaxID=1670830 RepID=A0A8J3ETH9_9ACTN|nr:YetF domain-containing protein [Egicoccus halophilus]GGI05228.1 DUF421 domain-containing protein [Egicoccus halophilus]